MLIHLVFHISLLEKAPLGAPPAPVTLIQAVNKDIDYNVEKILDHKKIRGKLYYLVKWLGYL